MDAYQLAINQAKGELADAQQRLKALTLRVSQLESVVTQLEALTAAGSLIRGPMLFDIDATPDTPKNGLPDKRLPSDRGQVNWHQAQAQAKVPLIHPGGEAPPPLWKAIVNALNGKKSDFTVPEALAALERTGRRVESPNRLNIIRNTLIHSKAFGRMGSGHYYVVGFEAKAADSQEKEASPEEKTS